MTRTGIAASLTALATVMSACDDFPPSPVSPTPVTQPALTAQPAPPTTPARLSTLSGQVFVASADGRIPVEGVRVYCDSCGPIGHSDSYSDTNGEYSFADVANGLTPLLVSAPGFRLSQSSGPGYAGFGRIDARVNGDTRFDIELVKQ